MNKNCWPGILAPVTGSESHPGSTFSVTQMFLSETSGHRLGQFIITSENIFYALHKYHLQTRSKIKSRLICLVNTCSSAQQLLHKAFPCSPLLKKRWPQGPRVGVGTKRTWAQLPHRQDHHSLMVPTWTRSEVDRCFTNLNSTVNRIPSLRLLPR